MNWYMCAADQNGNPVGKRVCITDSVLDTAAQEIAQDNSEQDQAAQALAETAYGVKDGVVAGVSWFE